jgi:hypothetical protein
MLRRSLELGRDRERHDKPRRHVVKYSALNDYHVGSSTVSSR